jgi:ABC-type nitrate/sulfonate/bicarbonate transport system permease component
MADLRLDRTWDPPLEHASWSKRFFTRYESLIFKCLGVIVTLGSWEIAYRLGWLNPNAVSSPSAIAVAGWGYVRSKEFLVDAETSGLEFLGGFALSIAVGVTIGFGMAWFRRVEYFLDPIINFLYAAPRIAVVPLLVLWFGIDIPSKIAIVFLMSVFPIIINTIMGVRSVDPDLIDLARSLDASQLQLLRTVVIPSSLPYIATGVRIALGIAFIGVVVGEFVASTAGVGFYIQQSATNFKVDRVFVGLFVIAIAGVLMTEAVRYLESRLAAWKTS